MGSYRKNPNFYLGKFHNVVAINSIRVGAASSQYKLADSSGNLYQGGVALSTSMTITSLASAAGTAVSISATDAGSSGAGPALTLAAGDAHTSGAGGKVDIDAGAGKGALAGGAIDLTPGTGGATGTGGALNLTSGASAGASGTAGDINIDTGAASGGTAGSIVIGENNADEVTFGCTLTLNGTTGNGINATGTFSDHVIDIQPAASMGDYKAIYIGTWGSEAEFADDGGLFRIYGKIESGGDVATNIFVRTLTDSTSKPISAQFYTDSDADSPGPVSMSAVDAFCMLNAGKYLAAGSSMYDHMRAAWFKIGADVTSHCDGNAIAIWVDNEMNCTVTGEEYGIFSTTGGSRPDAWAGFETYSSGYDQLLYFDETFNSGAGTCVTTDSVPGTQDARINVWYNDTQYYVPLYR